MPDGPTEPQPSPDQPPPYQAVPAPNQPGQPTWKDPKYDLPVDPDDKTTKPDDD